jgi:hypothetical protein
MEFSLEFFFTAKTCCQEVIVKKVTLALSLASKAQRGSTGIDLLIRDLGARRWVVSTTL